MTEKKKVQDSTEQYTEKTVKVGDQFVSFADSTVIGTVTELWFDRGHGLTITWSNGNQSKLYFLELKNPRHVN